MSNDQGKGGGQPVDDRTLLDPLDADELKALRDARKRLGGGRVSPVGPDAKASDEIGDAPTRAMMAIPSFDSASPPKNDKPNFMAEPKPMQSGAVSTHAEPATILAGTVGAGTAPKPTTGQGGSPPPGQQQAKAGASKGADSRAQSNQGFGENTLMWMQPVKAPEADVIPERGAAAAAGMIPTSAPAQTTGRLVMSYVLAGAFVLVAIFVGIVFLAPKPHPSVVELVTNPNKASVLIDGKETSVQTPMKATLPPGMHKIEVRLAGYKTEIFDLMIVEGAKPTRRQVELYPISKPGLMTLSIEVDPVAGNISLDGKMYPGRKVLRVKDINPKTAHTLEIEVGGYKKVTKDIAPGQLKDTYQIKLERLVDPP